MRTLEVVAGIIWQGELLLASQRIKGTHKDCWEFPGGKIDAGETAEQALRRELREELDITVSAMHPWRTVEYTYPDKQVRLHLFHITAFGGEPRSVEGQPFRWMGVQEAQSLHFLEADQPLLYYLTPPESGTCADDADMDEALPLLRCASA